MALPGSPKKDKLAAGLASAAVVGASAAEPGATGDEAEASAAALFGTTAASGTDATGVGRAGALLATGGSGAAIGELGEGMASAGIATKPGLKATAEATLGAAELGRNLGGRGRKNGCVGATAPFLAGGSACGAAAGMAAVAAGGGGAMGVGTAVPTVAALPASIGPVPLSSQGSDSSGKALMIFWTTSKLGLLRSLKM